jgi:dephospho-CoA kinase
MKLCVGLTGGIGCGKSKVAKLFAELGAGIIDTDVIAHQLTQSHGEAIPAIRNTFGNDCLTPDGALDRNKMRALIFTDDVAKQKLEGILHPLIFKQTQARIIQLQAMPYIVIVVPLLFTSPGFIRLVQRVLVVDCAEETQVERVTARSKMSPAEVRQIMAQQTPRTEQIRLADNTINNDSSLENLSKQIRELHKIYLATQSGI